MPELTRLLVRVTRWSVSPRITSGLLIVGRRGAVAGVTAIPVTATALDGLWPVRAGCATRNGIRGTGVRGTCATADAHIITAAQATGNRRRMLARKNMRVLCQYGGRDARMVQPLFFCPPLPPCPRPLNSRFTALSATSVALQHHAFHSSCHLPHGQIRKFRMSFRPDYPNFTQYPSAQQRV
jgi:hypothetical protein